MHFQQKEQKQSCALMETDKRKENDKILLPSYIKNCLFTMHKKHIFHNHSCWYQVWDPCVSKLAGLEGKFLTMVDQFCPVISCGDRVSLQEQFIPLTCTLTLCVQLYFWGLCYCVTWRQTKQMLTTRKLHAIRITLGASPSGFHLWILVTVWIHMRKYSFEK